MIKLRIFRVASVCMLLLWMCMIFGFSAQTAPESDATSGRVITLLLERFYPSFDTLTQAAKEELIAGLQFYIRKTAHFLIYAVLGVFAFLSVVTYPKVRLFLRTVGAFAVCVLYSLFDEWHQTAVSGRSGEVRDILIDSAGALLAILFVLLLCVWIKPIYRRVKSGGT